MKSVFQEIELAFVSSMQEYNKRITSKYNIDIKDLETIWKDVSRNIKVSVSFENTTSTTTTSTTSTTTTTPKTKIPTSTICPYKFIKGDKQNQLCGSKTKEGCVYCSRHNKHEGTQVKERSFTPDPKRTIVNAKPNKSNHPEKSLQRIIRKNKIIDKLWHPETCLVFKSDKERIVIGKCVDNIVMNLTLDDVDECRKWGFPFNEIKKELDNKTIDTPSDIEDTLNELQESSDDDSNKDIESENDEDMLEDEDDEE